MPNSPSEIMKPLYTSQNSVVCTMQKQHLPETFSTKNEKAHA